MPDADIRPFRVQVDQAEIDELRRRLRATRWPEKETVADQTQGVPLATIQELVRYWGSDYDFRRFETRLNAVPQFVTEIDGLDIHFLHVKSRHEGALPVIITHGWPGSIIEMLNVLGPLADPTAHGGNAADAFDVVVPSMPGYGFSERPTTTGWDPVHIADAWIVLMRRLGYSGYVAQGGDWGAQITDVIGSKAPPELLGIHSNMPGTVPAEISRALALNVLGRGRTAAGRIVGRRAARVRPAQLPVHQGPRLRPGDGPAPTDDVRPGRFSRGPGGLDARPRRLQPRRHRPGRRRAPRSTT